MPKSADIGSKRLISLAPVEWVRWLTGCSDVVVHEVLAEEFQWIGRASDAVIRAWSPECGEFAIANEIQLHYTGRIPRRMFAYAGLATEKLDLPVYPVLVNLLPPSERTVVADRYEASVMGLRGYQEYRVINLWEVDVNIVFDCPLPQLLPFVPLFRGGDDEAVVQRALHELRADERLSELEPLLAFFSTFVLKSDIVKRIMRWDMAVLMQSPWYQEIVEERVRKDILVGLDVRFGPVPPRIAERIRGVTDVDVLEALLRLAFAAESLDEFVRGFPEGS